MVVQIGQKINCSQHILPGLLFVTQVLAVFFLCLTKSHAQALSTFWDFTPGSTTETLKEFDIPSFFRVERVTLPHRIFMPDKALWYKGWIAKGDSLCLVLRADDGAQLWQDGVRVYGDQQGLHCLSAIEDTSVLVIRVLNNAVKGGLHGIRKILPPKIVHQTGPGSSKPEIQPLCNRSGGLSSPDKSNYVVQVWGDSQGGWDVFRQLCGLMVAQEADLNIGVGDLVSKGINLNEWVTFSSIIQPVCQRVPILLLPGNHDYDGYTDHLKAENYLRVCRAGKSTSYFFYQEKEVAFVALDPNCNFPLAIDRNQQLWADSIFRSLPWRNAKWKVILLHQVPYGAGWPGYDGDQFIRNYLDSVADVANFDLVIGGHIHDYERVVKKIRGRNRLFLVTGGAGGSLEPKENDAHWKMDVIHKVHHFCTLSFTKDELEIQVTDLQGDIIDQYKFKKDEK